MRKNPTFLSNILVNDDGLVVGDPNLGLMVVVTGVSAALSPSF